MRADGGRPRGECGRAAPSCSTGTTGVFCPCTKARCRVFGSSSGSIPPPPHRLPRSARPSRGRRTAPKTPPRTRLRVGVDSGGKLIQDAPVAPWARSDTGTPHTNAPPRPQLRDLPLDNLRGAGLPRPSTCDFPTLPSLLPSGSPGWCRWRAGGARCRRSPYAGRRLGAVSRPVRAGIQTLLRQRSNDRESACGGC